MTLNDWDNQSNLFSDYPVTSTGPLKRNCPLCRGMLVQVLGGWVCDTCDFHKSDEAHARGSDPETSHEAAAAQDPEKLRDSQREVLTLFEQHGPMIDLTMMACAERAGIKQSPSGLRTRRHELKEKGLLRHSGRYEVVGKRRHIIWELVV